MKMIEKIGLGRLASLAVFDDIFGGLWSDSGRGSWFGVIGRRTDGSRSERNGII